MCVILVESGDPDVNTKEKQLVSSGSYFLLASWFLAPVMGVGNLPLLQSNVDARSARKSVLYLYSLVTDGCLQVIK